MIFILMGPSGSGKTAIGKGSGLPELISHTSRKMREGEIHGKDYYFTTKEDILKIDKVEFTEYDNEYYCLSRKEVENKLKRYGSVFVIMDRNGAEQIIEAYSKKDVRVIYVTAPFFQLYWRLIKRDGLKKATKRMYHAVRTGEFKNKDIANYVINNKNGKLDKSIELFKEIVRIVVLCNNKKYRGRKVLKK